MKWFFALNGSSSRFEEYAAMVKVAVVSARRNTSLDAHCLFDGEDCALTRWLTTNGVRVIFRRTALYPSIAEVAERVRDREFLTTAAGAYLRTDLPVAMSDLGMTDRRVLYTDCDVMFRREVVNELERMRPIYFAVAPEDDPKSRNRMNSGVMLMNIHRLRRRNKRFLQFATREIELRQALDQDAYRRFFRLYGFPLWNRLPIELNWKPYWGVNDSARIVHFHGPKPVNAELFRKGGGTPSHRRFVNESFFHYAHEWKSYGGVLEENPA